MIDAILFANAGQSGWIDHAAARFALAAVASGGLAVTLGLLLIRTRRRLAAVSALQSADAAVLQAMFQTCPLGMFQTAPDGRVLRANDAFLALLGRSRPDVAAGRVEWVAPPGPIGPDGIASYDLEHTPPGGTLLQLQVIFSRCKDGGGVGFVSDQTTLRETEARFRRAVTAARVGTWDWDVTHDRLQLSPPGLEQQMFERQPGSITRMREFLRIIEPTRRKPLLRGINEVIRMAHMNEYEPEFPVRISDGTSRWFRAPGRVTARDPADQALRLSGVVVDITERRRITEALHQLTDNLERRVRAEVAAREAAQMRAARAERLQALGQLASGIAHDINNLLQAVAGASTLIEHRQQDDEAFARFVRILDDATTRGASITQRLLTFARRDALRQDMVEPTTLLAGMREILAHTLGGTIEVRLGPPADMPPIMADRGQLETVLVNLATNARDAMPAGGVLTLSADVRVIEDRLATGPGVVQDELALGRYLVLSVADTGTGMDAATLARVTEPFFTTKPLGEGTGLGLSMAKAFAEQSGGCLAIESRVGHGTTVSIWLPVVSPAAEPEQGPPEEEPAPIPLGQQRAPASVRVLLVDDDALVCEAMHDVLADIGFNVVSAPSAEAAVALLEGGERFDILVTDLSMPRMDGLSLIQLFQEREPHLPAILLTGFSEGSVASAVQASTEGTVAILRKPVPALQLAGRISAMVPPSPPDAPGTAQAE